MDYVKVAHLGNLGFFRGACDPHALSRFIAEIPRWIDRLRLRPLLDETRNIVSFTRPIDAHALACVVLLLCTVTLVCVTVADFDTESSSATVTAFMLSGCLIGTKLPRNGLVKRSPALFEKKRAIPRSIESWPLNSFCRRSGSAPGRGGFRGA